jgi:hypothetical protein
MGQGRRVEPPGVLAHRIDAAAEPGDPVERALERLAAKW